MMDYRCGKFGNCNLSRFGFVLCTDRHTHTDVEDDRCTHTAPTGMSDKHMIHLLTQYFTFVVAYNNNNNTTIYKEP